jgi:hypothetical protein
VQHHLETFLARAEQEDPLSYGVPGWVERDFRAYLRCGIPAHGFARVRCGDCGQERLLRAVRFELRLRSPGAPPGACIAAISFPQRFGSSLNPHFHYHVLALGPLFSEEPPGEVRFHEANGLSPDHAHGVARTVQRHVLRAFRRREILDDATVADMLDWQATGGFSVDASVRIERDDRAGVERLVRYCARPPFALERLHALYDPRRPRLRGRAPPLPPPRARPPRSYRARALAARAARAARAPDPAAAHARHHYHGVLAPNARLRAAVVAIARGAPDTDMPEPADASSPAAGRSGSSGSEHSRRGDPPPVRNRPSRLAWALLLARIYEVLPLLCPACGGPMRVVAFLTEPPIVRPILLHLGLPDRPPPVAPARGPPQAEIDFDQTPGYDPADGDRGPTSNSTSRSRKTSSSERASQAPTRWSQGSCSLLLPSDCGAGARRWLPRSRISGGTV